MMNVFIAAYKLNPNEIGLPSNTTNITMGVTEAIQGIMVLLGALAVIMIIVGGIQMALSTGNPARIAKSRDVVLYAVVGLVVASSAYAIVTFLANNIGK